MKKRLLKSQSVLDLLMFSLLFFFFHYFTLQEGLYGPTQHLLRWTTRLSRSSSSFAKFTQYLLRWSLLTVFLALLRFTTSTAAT